jgi:hypothetical protein
MYRFQVIVSAKNRRMIYSVKHNITKKRYPGSLAALDTSFLYRHCSAIRAISSDKLADFQQRRIYLH